MNPDIATIRKKVLSSDEYSKSWLTPNDFYGWFITLKIFLPFLLVVILTPLAYEKFQNTNFSYVVLAISFFLLGIFAYKFSFLLHETCHYTLFKIKKTNELVGTFAGYFSGTNFEIYKFIHMLHHKWNGELQDPQIDDCLNRQSRRTKKQLLVHILEPLLFGRLISFLSHYFTFIPERFKTKYEYQNDPNMPKSNWSFYLGVFLSQIFIILVITQFLKFPALALLYPFAAVLISLFLARIRAIVEHTRANDIQDKDFTRSHQFNFFEEFLLYEANFNFHFEHHVFPQMPAFYLPKFNKTFFDTLHPNKKTFSNSMIMTIYDCYKSFD
jgi:fatty acid desaturase